MSPELETLDQLLSGEPMPLAAIRALYPNPEAFMHGTLGLLRNGDVRLLHAGTQVLRWRWRELLVDGAVMAELPSLQLEITEQGAERIR